MRNPLNKLSLEKRSLVQAGVVLLVVAGWHLGAMITRPGGARKAAKELGPISQFREDMYPNHGGTGVVFSRETETGVGLFFCNATSGRTKLLQEHKEKDYPWQRFGLLGFSPDDKFFAYATPTGTPKQRTEELVVCSGTTGDDLGRFSANTGLLSVAWLTPDSFVSLNGNQDMNEYSRKADGKWVELRRITAPPAPARGRNGGGAGATAGAPANRGRIGGGAAPRPAANAALTQDNSFTAFSESAVAWRRGDAVWATDIRASSPRIIWQPTNQSTVTHIEGFTYSKEDAALIVNCTDDSGPYWMWLRPTTDTNHEAEVLKTERADTRPNYAYVRDDNGQNN